MFNRILTALAGSLHTAKVAETYQEKQAVFRFRYKIFVENLHMRPPGADEKNKLVPTPVENEKECFILYTGDLENITSSLTLRVWEKGTFPEHFREKYDTSIFDNFQDMTVGEISFLLIDPQARGALLPRALFKKLYEIHLDPAPDVVFCYSVPGLVTYYEKLSLRTYTSRFIQLDDGIRVPMLLMPFDTNYLREVKAPMAHAAIHNGKRLGYFTNQHFSNTVISNISKAKAAITSKSKIEELILSSGILPDTFNLMTFISLKDLCRLSSLIMKIPENYYILKKGTENREIFVILDGKVSVEIEKKTIKILEKGDIFGEIAFFLREGRRTADIKSKTPLVVAVIRRNDIKRIMGSDKILALNFLYGITRIVCTRLADVVEAFPLTNESLKKLEKD